MIRCLPVFVWALLAGTSHGGRSSETTGSSPLTVWTDLELMLQQVEHVRNEYYGRRNLEAEDQVLDEEAPAEGTPEEEDTADEHEVGMLCSFAVELFDLVAPQNQNRDCSCNLWARSIQCHYESVTCRDKILPSLTVKFDLGFRSNTVHICQEFMENEFEEVCIEAEMEGMQFGVCKEATMGNGILGTKKCSCAVCEDGITLDLDCTEKHPLATTNGCQRVFFQDTCLDFDPSALGEVNATDLVPDEALEVPNQEPTVKEEGPMEAVGLEGNEHQEIGNTPQKQQSTAANPIPETVQTSRFFFDDGETVTVTPQQEAAAWSTSDPNADSYNTTKRIQRYAMAAFYYATTAFDTQWLDSANWLSYAVDECNWFSVSDEPCTPTGELESLDLSNNALAGRLNPEIGYLRSVKYFYLSENDLSGSVPSTAGMLTNLIDFELRNSNLNGTIPSELGLLTNLEALSLNDNWLSGTIPSELGLLTNVFAIELDGNDIIGTVPDELCNLIATNGVELYVDCDNGLGSGVQCNCGCVCTNIWK